MLCCKYVRFRLTAFGILIISTYVMKRQLKERKCAARDCDIRFTPRIKTQKFHSRKCNDRESQRLYREKKAVTA
jgi:hypothetical protein